jgi:uncharacterized protein with HEPN domain
VIRATRPRLQDIDEHIGYALDLVKGRTLKHLTTDYAMRLALFHAIQIIAEAVDKLPSEMHVAYPAVPWRNIKATGNHIKHEYHRIDPEIIWDVATVHLKPLHLVIKRLLADEDQPTLPL